MKNKMDANEIPVPREAWERVDTIRLILEKVPQAEEITDVCVGLFHANWELVVYTRSHRYVFCWEEWAVKTAKRIKQVWVL